MQMSHNGGTLKVQSHRVCVVYESASGRILHVHHDIALPGGAKASEHDVEAAAMAQLRKRGRHTAQLRALHVKPHEMQPSARYSVDPQRLVLKRLTAK